MRKLTATTRMMLVAISILGLSISVVLAQTGGYDLNWFTADGGGGTASGGSYTLSGAVGQADAGAMSNGGYVLMGGFWNEGILWFGVYLPLIHK